MNWIQKLERRFGRYAIHNLMFYIIILNVAGFLMMTAMPQIFYQYLPLSVPAVLRGQVWRLFTFVMVPPSGSLFGMFFFCLLYNSIGQALEHTWGTFRFNLYLFSGILLHIITAFIVYGLFHIDLHMNLMYLNTTLLMAYGAEFPEHQILFFFIPVKVKWLAILEGVYLGLTIVGGFLSGVFSQSLIGIPSSMPSAVAALIASGNFLFYFLNSRRFARYNPKQIKRRADYNKKVKMAAPLSRGATRHKCAVCGRTELDGNDLEFRFCSKCEGAYEYCQDHLYTHKHVTTKG